MYIYILSWIHMYIYMYTYIYTHIYTHIRICIYNIYIYTYIYICTYAYVHTPSHTHGARGGHRAFEHDHLAVWRQHTCARIYICIHTRIDIYIRTHQVQEGYIGPSFTTISSYGANGAVIHYHPTEWVPTPIQISHTLEFVDHVTWAVFHDDFSSQICWQVRIRMYL